MSDPPGIETRAEPPDLEPGEQLVDPQETNPLPLSADLYAAEYLAGYESPFGLYQTEPWRDTAPGQAGYTGTGGTVRVPVTPSIGNSPGQSVTVEGGSYGPVATDWYSTTPADGFRLGPDDHTEASLQYRPREDPLPNMRGDEGYDRRHDDQTDARLTDTVNTGPREIGEGPEEFQHPDWNQENWEDNYDGEDTDFHSDEERAAHAAGYIPLHFFQKDVRDIHIFWRWVGGMSAEHTEARAIGWLRIERLLRSVQDQLVGRGRTLMETWTSAAGNASASENFMIEMDASAASLDRWTWVADRHKTALNRIASAIRTAQDELGPLYTHYRVARALLDNWPAIYSSNQDPVYASSDTSDLPPLGNLDHHPGYSDGETNILPIGGGGDPERAMRINDPSDGWNPATTPVLYNGQGGEIEINSVDDLLQAYHNRAAAIVQPLADTYYNEHLLSLTRMRGWDGPLPDDVSPPRNWDDVNPTGLVDGLLAQVGASIPGPGGGLGGVPSMSDNPLFNGPGTGVPAPGISPDLTGLPVGGFPGGLPSQPDGGFLAGTPVAFANQPPVATPPIPGGPSQLTVPGMPPAIVPPTLPVSPAPAPQQQIAAQQAAQVAAQQAAQAAAQQAAQAAQAAQQAAIAAQQAVNNVALPGGQPSISVQPGVAPEGVAAGVSPVQAGQPVTLPGVSPAAATAPGTLPLTAVAGQVAPGGFAPGIAPPGVDATGVSVPVQGGAALPGVTGGAVGLTDAQAMAMMPPPPPPIVPPVAGSQQGGQRSSGQTAGPAGMPPPPSPLFVPPGRVTSTGRAATAPQRIPPTLAGASAKPGRTARLAGVQGASTTQRQEPAQQVRKPETVTVPGEHDRELWTVKKPKGLLQGAPPPEPAKQGKPIGSA
jgi:hypothetical protein